MQTFHDSDGNAVRVPVRALVPRPTALPADYSTSVPKIHPIRYAQGRYYYPTASGSREDVSTGYQSPVENGDYLAKYFGHPKRNT
jgi:hypothetical protein